MYLTPLPLISLVLSGNRLPQSFQKEWQFYEISVLMVFTQREGSKTELACVAGGFV